MRGTPLLLKNGLIINEGRTFRGDLVINNKLIEKIYPGGHQGRFNEETGRSVDLEGLLIFPGVIDDHVHFREPGLTHKGDIATESVAAVAGGITSFMEMPNTNPQTISADLLEDKFRLAQEKSLANFSFYMGATNTNKPELMAADPKHVCGIKIFMGSSTGNMLMDDSGALNDLFREVKLPVAVHCEDEETIRKQLTAAKATYGEDIPMAMHMHIRNHQACERSSRLAVSLAEKYGTRLHLLHLSTADELRMLENSTPLSDKQITAEVCVHHLWFSAEDYAEKGGLIKWNPAIKFNEDRMALIDGVRKGYIDVVATDHAPHTLEEKSNNYLACPSGGPMVQHTLPAMVTLAEKQQIPLEKIASLMCHNPAICFNVANRGFIREGYAADLVVIDPGTPFTVSKENILYKCKWSPLEGKELKATVSYTFVNGHLVYENGTINDEVKGEALLFSR